MDAPDAVELRDYREADLPAVTRMWREVGWIDDSDREAEALRTFLGYGAARVGAIHGEAECLVHRTPGTIRYDQHDLALCAVTAVTTSAVARGLGLASQLAGEAVAAGALDGAAVAALGMFEQGFYDRFGFGSLGYEIEMSFDPAKLRLGAPARRPVRVERTDWQEVAQLMGRRARGHGGVSLDPPAAMRAELGWVDDPYLGLGVRGRDGRLTGCLIGTNVGEHGPLKVQVVGYETHDDLRDLLAILRSLRAQIHEVLLVEPAAIQLQDLLEEPIRGHELLDPDRRPRHSAMAWCQLRILDLERCAAARTWPGPEVAFDLDLRDPVGGPGVAWPGLSGPWSITVGAPSSASRGHRGGLPVVRASVGALSRLWFGVRPATGLAVTDDLVGPPELLAALDEALRLPPPRPGLSF